MKCFQIFLWVSRNHLLGGGLTGSHETRTGGSAAGSGPHKVIKFPSLVSEIKFVASVGSMCRAFGCFRWMFVKNVTPVRFYCASCRFGPREQSCTFTHRAAVLTFTVRWLWFWLRWRLKFGWTEPIVALNERRTILSTFHFSPCLLWFLFSCW